jgi:Fuc2NAc and GlcNAc transferase
VTAFIIFVVFVASYFLTMAARRYALANQLLDVPNSRSSHTVPTPSGGGVAIVVAWLVGAIFLGIVGGIGWPLLLTLLPPALTIAFVGFIDDRIGVSAWLRLLVHFVAAGWFIVMSGDMISTGIPILDNTPWILISVCAVGLVWLTNLYNFMDGIDGIAAAEAVFLSLVFAVICYLSDAQDIAAISALLAAACAGFLIWNWPPARIFMGDTGSSWAGFMVGAIALTGSGRTGINIAPWIILLGAFLVDATVTLIRRLATGERWYEAHRTHAYQILSKSWGGHRVVTLVVLMVNVIWLMPMAVWAYSDPSRSLMIVIIALSPLLAAVIWIRDG